MGLDITVYSFVRLRPDLNQESYDWQDDSLRELYVNPDFPAQADGLVSGVYEAEKAFGFRAGSYGSYSAWREQLARLAQYAPVATDERLPHSYGAWNADHGPFWELINFSDCEGVIGPQTSAKLAADFSAWDQRAKEQMDSYVYDLYKSWRQAFETAAGNGAVAFH